MYLRNNNHDAFDEFWFWWTTVLFGNGLIPTTFVSISFQFAGSLHHDICSGIDIVLSFNTAIQVDDDGSRPDALLRDRLPGYMSAQ